MTMRIASTPTRSSSATCCASDVRMFWPISTLPVKTVTLPSLSMCSQAARSFGSSCDCARAAGLLGETAARRRGGGDGDAAAEDLQEAPAVEREPVEGRDGVLGELESSRVAPRGALCGHVARRALTSAPPSRSRAFAALHRLQDPRIRPAAADVPRQRPRRCPPRSGSRSPAAARRDATIMPERAVAALERLGLEERRLHGMEPSVLRETLDRDDLLARGLGQRRLAGRRRLPVEEHGARAALSLAAAVLGAGQVEPVAEDGEERLVRRRVDAPLLAR